MMTRCQRVVTNHQLSPLQQLHYASLQFVFPNQGFASPICPLHPPLQPAKLHEKRKSSHIHVGKEMLLRRRVGLEIHWVEVQIIIRRQIQIPISFPLLLLHLSKMLSSLRFSPHTGFSIREALISHPILYPLQRSSSFFFFSRRNPRNNSFSTATSSFKETHEENSPLSGLEDALMGYISGKKKATELAHMVWQRIARKGDHVVDATCGNGYDTLALLKMVADESGMGRVYGLDIQDCALKSTSSLLDESVEPNERRLVELFPLCHSKMEDIIPKGVFVRLIVFNLGYLPGGDKTIITVPEKTSQALQAACKILESGGLISMMVYVGHPGGREEYKTIQDFASGLPSENWVCCKFEMVNRPMAPVLVFLFKK